MSIARNRLEQPQSKPNPLLRESWIERLHRIEAELAAREADPWHVQLAKLRGTVGDDGIERVTTQAVFDVLEVPQRSRGAGASRRLAKTMVECGWAPVRVRGITRGGYREQVRGYARVPAQPAR